MVDRWFKAQQAEKEHSTHRLMAEKKEAISKLSNLGFDLTDFDESRVLAVGGGTGMIHALSTAEFAVSVDPITTERRDVLDDSTAQLITGAGERLPFDDNYFDYVICYNVLDHTLNPSDVLTEIHRVLDDCGQLLFKLNTYELPKVILNRLSVLDRPHLHHYNRESVLDFVLEHGFNPEVTKYQRRSFKDYNQASIKKIIATIFLRWGQIWFTATVDRK